MVECRSCRMYFTIKWVLVRSYLCIKCCMRGTTGKKVPERWRCSWKSGWIQARPKDRVDEGKKKVQQRISDDNGWIPSLRRNRHGRKTNNKIFQHGFVAPEDKDKKEEKTERRRRGRTNVSRRADRDTGTTRKIYGNRIIHWGLCRRIEENIF